MPRQTLSVVVPTFNAAPVLRGCLDSVAWADEIVVVDRHSTDETRAICAEQPRCRFFERDDLIQANYNFGFDQAVCDWILRLDADERLTPELADEIRAILEAPPSADIVGYSARQRIFILGRELLHGRARGSTRHTLFRRGTARYPLRTEHDELEAEGTWLPLRGTYLHYNYARVSDYLEKTQYYTTVDVDRAELESAPPSIGRGLLRTAQAFYLDYVKRQGFRDGWVGFLDAGMRSMYQFVAWAKTRERWENEGGQR